MEVLKSPARADSVSVKIFSKQLTTFWVTSESRVEARLEAKGDEATKDRRWGRLNTVTVQIEDQAGLYYQNYHD